MLIGNIIDVNDKVYTLSIYTSFGILTKKYREDQLEKMMSKLYIITNRKTGDIVRRFDARYKARGYIDGFTDDEREQYSITETNI
ncbi:hypothetical protein FC92_GL001068 [Liquorilactobacillus hordei DSM 19519]|uniref:Uncharacterized protein n=1 Tax=Liquorilactobacillus hordei DSM 19519 TaxID=1423759 RepID=A0A0R1MIZ6_9LACO|nr:hypothetical protein FC92_GL001068 [Liquorilactobacillus hordei DSM 19519]